MEKSKEREQPELKYRSDEELINIFLYLHERYGIDESLDFDNVEKTHNFMNRIFIYQNRIRNKEAYYTMAKVKMAELLGQDGNRLRIIKFITKYSDKLNPAGGMDIIEDAMKLMGMKHERTV